MGSNQNPWTPYKDCSLGICTIYCPQFCYFIFPPPPPDDDDSTTGFSPLIIAIIGVLAGAFILVSYYTIANRCRRRNPTTSAGAAELHREAANGLEEAVIKTITVCKYREGEGLIEGSECAVCLSEFQENEALRLLPKCSHAFHLPCIDTWLKSHSNCPLCRAGVMGSPHPIPPPQAPTLDSNFEFERPRDDELVIMVDNRDADDGGDAMPRSPNQEDEEGVSYLRRSASLGTLPSQRRCLVSDNAKIDGVKGRSWREIGSSNTSGTVELVSSNCKGKNTMLLPD